MKVNLNFIYLFCCLFCCLGGCQIKDNLENKILIYAKRSDDPVASKNSMSKFKYYWNGKLFKDTNPFDARYSEQYNYFLIYIDSTNPGKWISYSRQDFGYSDTSNISDSLRKKIHLNVIDFNLLESEH